MGVKSEKGRVKSDCSARSSSLTHSALAELLIAHEWARIYTDFSLTE